MKTKLISLMLVLVLMVCIATVPSMADTSENSTFAYLMYADASWTNQYWGTDDSSVKAAKADITGPGEYTVGLDFTGTEAGVASGIAFTALGIQNGELAFPYYTIELTSIKINGEDIEFTKGYTSSDDGITTRMNIYNEWVSELPYDARSFDNNISDASAVIVSKDAFASVRTIEVSFKLHAPQDVAYLMYADSTWTYQYWGDPVDTGVVAENATISGPGTYTVGLDFTQTADKKASGLAFTALGIKTGERSFPGYFIKIKDIKVNGKSISLKKGYTSSDDKIVTRMNIYNEWVANLPDDARSYDGKVDDANWIIVDKDAFASVETVEVTFDFVQPSAEAYIMYADTAWDNTYFNDGTETAIIPTNAKVTDPGHYKVALDFRSTEDKAASGLAFTAVGIKDAEISHPGWFIKIESIKVNGREIEFTKGYTSSDNGKETRMNIYNEWETALPDNARSYDKKLDDASWKIVDPAAFANVETLEIEFAFIRGERPKKEKDADIDIDAALAADYNAYFGIQTESYIFRNAWNEKNYGKETDYFTHLTGWDSDNNAVDYGGTLKDAAVTGNGTYTVGVDLGPMGLGSDQTIRMLYVSTDIPSVLVDKGYVTISDVKTSIDGGKAQTAFTVNTDGDYVQIDILNEYTSTGTEAISYKMPTKSVTITFTVSGLSKDAGSAGASASGLPKAGGVPGELMYVLGCAVTSLGIYMKARKKKV
ncbi:MAG TPA: hypothetical protein PK767_06990 [Clostridiales bacterium]|nr:hypothetical protein [Clostridiales bacterium]